MSSQTLRIAAAQMEARTGDVDFDPAQVEKLVRDAANKVPSG
jgi:predicted amidohydrolase